MTRAIIPVVLCALVLYLLVGVALCMCTAYHFKCLSQVGGHKTLGQVCIPATGSSQYGTEPDLGGSAHIHHLCLSKPLVPTVSYHIQCGWVHQRVLHRKRQNHLGVSL